MSLSSRIEACLPQTQCGRCGYDGCNPYAQAVASGAAAPNRCPPGGTSTARALSDVLGLEVGPVDPECGQAKLWTTVRIDENLCIGCVLCIRACPVDAIVGAAKRGHAVIQSECTGCELCIAPCPVDCIELVQAGTEPGHGVAYASWREWMDSRAERGRRRYHARRLRLADKTQRETSTTIASPAADAPAADARMQRTIEAALARVAARRKPSAANSPAGAESHERDET